MVSTYISEKILPTGKFNALKDKQPDKAQELLDEVEKQMICAFENIYDAWDDDMLEAAKNSNGSVVSDKVRTFFSKAEVTREIFNVIKFNLIDVRRAELEKRTINPKEDYMLYDSYNNYESYRLQYLFTQDSIDMAKDFTEEVLKGYVNTNTMLKIYDENKSFYDICSEQYHEEENIVSFSSFMSINCHRRNFISTDKLTNYNMDENVA
jgi:hypothetical protein